MYNEVMPGHIGEFVKLVKINQTKLLFSKSAEARTEDVHSGCIVAQLARLARLLTKVHTRVRRT